MLPRTLTAAVLTVMLAWGGGAGDVIRASRGADPAAEAPRFFRAINLNGPAIEIDGRAWDGGDATDIVCQDAAFENQAVPLLPPTDDARARMIRSSRWSPEGRASLALTGVPAGVYYIRLVTAQGRFVHAMTRLR